MKVFTNVACFLAIIAVTFAFTTQWGERRVLDRLIRTDKVYANNSTGYVNATDIINNNATDIVHNNVSPFCS